MRIPQNTFDVLTLTTVLACLGAGCGYEAEIHDVEVREVTPGGPLELDVLFVIDNSGSMAEEQQSLVDNFHILINQLETLPGGLPSIHVGVVSTDLGAGGYPVVGCDGDGDDGQMQSAPQVPGCNPPSDPYISDIVLADGSRQSNYTGSLLDTFTCIGLIGIQGCGFEQPFESMKRALVKAGDPMSPNGGFLRDDAYLAVIFIGDEDDCSATDPSVFDTSQNDVGDPLGPVSSFRCVEFGVRCDNMDVARTPATYASCEPRGDSYLVDPDDYVTFLNSLKDHPSKLFVAMIVGDDGPLDVTTSDLGNPQTEPSCSGPAGNAYAGYRLRYFAEEFNNHSTTSICGPNLVGAITAVSESLHQALTEEPADPGDDPEPADPTDDDPKVSAGCSASGTTGSGMAWLLALALALVAIRRRPSHG